MRILITALSICLFALSTSAQMSELAKDHKQDFVTPDHPAFKILDFDPSDILRPSNIKEFSTITSEYFKAPAYVLPRSFSMEFSPALLITGNSLTVQKYADDWMAYGCRISVATKAVDEKWQKRDLGIGFRMTLVDEGDFRKDKRFLEPFKEQILLAGEKVKEKQEFIDHKIATDSVLVELKRQLGSPGLSEGARFDLNEKWNREHSRVKSDAEKAFPADSIRFAQIDMAINTLRKTYIDDNWNATRVDWGIATKLITPDTVLSSSIQYNKTSFWFTGALRLNKADREKRKVQHQLLVGINLNHEYRGIQTLDSLMTNPDSTTTSVSYVFNPDSSLYNKVGYSLSLRYYLGTNRVKGFLEAQLKGHSYFQEKVLDVENDIYKRSTEHVVDFLFRGGLEVNVSDGIWVNANVGYSAKRNTTLKVNSSDFVYGFDLRFNLPEKFKLF